MSISVLLDLILGWGPRLLALYHQEQGAHLLADGRGKGAFLLELEPLPRPEAQPLAAQALARVRDPVAVDPANFQAHRWLGPGRTGPRRTEEAILALSLTARLRPDSDLACGTRVGLRTVGLGACFP